MAILTGQGGDLDRAARKPKEGGAAIWLGRGGGLDKGDGDKRWPAKTHGGQESSKKERR